MGINDGELRLSRFIVWGMLPHLMLHCNGHQASSAVVLRGGARAAVDARATSVARGCRMATDIKRRAATSAIVASSDRSG